MMCNAKARIIYKGGQNVLPLHKYKTMIGDFHTNPPFC